MTTIKIHNTETNEIIERNMTSDELLIYEAEKQEAEAERLVRENAAKARAALLEKLGITEEEARLLLG